MIALSIKATEDVQMRIEHANITVKDVQASSEFYRQALGFETRWTGLTGSGQNAVHVGTEDLYISLFEAARPARIPSDYGASGFNHLAFVVDDLDAYRERLDRLGVKVQHPEPYEPGRRLYFFDPDGIEIELVEY